MHVPPEYVPPDPSQIVPVLAQAESVSIIAPRAVVTRRSGQNFSPFASLIASKLEIRVDAVPMPVSERKCDSRHPWSPLRV
jgi:hypothetical protein